MSFGVHRMHESSRLTLTASNRLLETISALVPDRLPLTCLTPVLPSRPLPSNSLLVDSTLCSLGLVAPVPPLPTPPLLALVKAGQVKSLELRVRDLCLRGRLLW